MTAGIPVLWQIKVSHYSEKVRWALDYKRVAHRRRAPLPLIGTLPIAWLLTRGTTFPVLRLDGRWIGDSTRIIAALEQRFRDRRCTRRIAPSASARWRPRSSSTSSWRRTCGGWSGTRRWPTRAPSRHRDA